MWDEKPIAPEFIGDFTVSDMIKICDRWDLNDREGRIQLIHRLRKLDEFNGEIPLIKFENNYSTDSECKLTGYMKYEIKNCVAECIDQKTMMYDDEKIMLNVKKRFEARGFLNGIINENNKKILMNNAGIYAKQQRGVFLEEHIVKQINSEGFDFKTDQSIINVKCDFGNFVLRGRVDGYDPEKKIVLEVKTRGSDQPEGPSDKEMLQIAAYMRLKNSNKCMFVEYGPNGPIRSKHIILNNHRLFESCIRDKLDEYVKFVRKLTRQSIEKTINDYNNSNSLNFKF